MMMITASKVVPLSATSPGHPGKKALFAMMVKRDPEIKKFIHRVRIKSPSPVLEYRNPLTAPTADPTISAIKTVNIVGRQKIRPIIIIADLPANHQFLHIPFGRSFNCQYQKIKSGYTAHQIREELSF